MTKLILHSNAPWAPTGYGQQTALFAPLLNEQYDLTLSANYGLEGAPIVWQGIPVLPGLGQTHGNEAIPGHVTAMFDSPREGLVMTLYDVPPLDPKIFKRLNTACWVPVDHNPATPAQIAFFRASQAIPLALSRHAEAELAEFDPIYVPHGVDTEVYKPTPSDVRERMEVPKDAFLIGMVAANKGRPSRKCFQQALEAVRFFRKRHENVYVYIHTTLAPEFAGGEDIPALAASLEIPEERFKYPNQYSMIFSPVSAKLMAQLYTAFDVLLNPSMGEGFGLPVLEAQACGTPAVVTDFSAMSEVCGAGWKVSGRSYWTGQHSWMCVPDVGEIIEALDDCYLLTEGRKRALSTQAVQHAGQYAARMVFDEHMLPALKEVEERIGNQAPVKVAA